VQITCLAYCSACICAQTTGQLTIQYNADFTAMQSVAAITGSVPAFFSSTFVTGIAAPAGYTAEAYCMASGTSGSTSLIGNWVTVNGTAQSHCAPSAGSSSLAGSYFSVFPDGSHEPGSLTGKYFWSNRAVAANWVSAGGPFHPIAGKQIAKFIAGSPAHVVIQSTVVRVALWCFVCC